jgi:tetratricopeptide (TPR) repeat protein
MRQGRLERALDLLGAAYTSALELAMRSQAAVAAHFRAQITYLMGRFLDALEFCREELEIWRDLGAPAQEAQALQTLATIYCQLGRHQDAILTLEETQAILDQLGDSVLAARNLYHLASTIPYHDEAQLTSAISMAEQALDVFETNQQTRWVASTLRALGYCHWLAGDYAQALEKYKLAYDLHDRCGEMSILPEILAYQALTLLGLGRLEEALECSRRAVLNLTSLTLENDLNSEIFYAHAAVLDAMGNQQEAHKYFTQAYENLLVYAQPIVDEQARQAYFERDPTVRRLMRELYARGIAGSPQDGVVERSLHPRLGHTLRPVEVRLTLDAGPADQALKQGKGAIALRRAKLERIRNEARIQGASPTIQEIAELLGVSARTVKRDLAAMRKKGKS